MLEHAMSTAMCSHVHAQLERGLIYSKHKIAVLGDCETWAYWCKQGCQHCIARCWWEHAKVMGATNSRHAVFALDAAQRAL